MIERIFAICHDEYLYFNPEGLKMPILLKIKRA